MLKINKFLRLSRSPLHDTTHRFMSADWVRNCPPVYECKQPQPNPMDDYWAHWAHHSKPNLFRKHCHKDFKIYRNILFFLCLPAVFCVAINTFYMNSEVRKRPKFIPFSHMRIRRKAFPWDEKRSLFHNPRYNALPEGYEIEVPEEEEFDPFSVHRK